MRKPCVWKRVIIEDMLYTTSCNQVKDFCVGGLEVNEYKFCPFCGGEILEEINNE